MELHRITLRDGFQLPPSPLNPYEVRITPDPCLHRVSEDLPDTTDKDFLPHVSKMIHTMYYHGGIGLAAPQVGRNERLIVVDTEWPSTQKFSPLVMINPKLIKGELPAPSREGCLSVGAQFFCDVTRFYKCVVEYTDLDGQNQLLLCEGLFSACLQHEIDHLNGILFTDKLSKLKRDLYKKKVMKLKRKAKHQVQTVDKFIRERDGSKDS